MKSTKRFSWSAGVVFLVAFFLMSGSSAFGYKPRVNMLVAPMGSGAMEGNQMLQGILDRRGADVHLEAQETPGYIYNLRAMSLEPGRWKNTVFLSEEDVIAAARLGGEPDVKEFFPEKLDREWRILWGKGRCAAGHTYITFDPNIKTIEDIKGKRVGLGRRTMSCWGMVAYHNLLFGAGITPDNTDIFHMGPRPATEALIDGTVDVIMNGFKMNHDASILNLPGHLRELEATGRKFYYVEVPQEALDKANEAIGKRTPSFTLAAGSMPQQDRDILIAADAEYAVASPEFDEEAAYRLVKAVATYGPQLKGSHSYWDVVTHDMMLYGLSEENTHPGAVRAYKELGLWDLTKNSEPSPYFN